MLLISNVSNSYKAIFLKVTGNFFDVVKYILLSFCLIINSAYAEIPGEFFLFPFLQFKYQSKQENGGEINTVVPGTDIFYTVDIGKFRFLTEVFIDTQEQELERLQLGWNFSDKLTLWLGRYHNHLGYWNTAVHHGLYLQTSISRPGIIEFEDEGGVLPTHLSGALLQGEYSFQESAIGYNIGLGVGPGLDDSVLNPFDFINPNKSSHKLSGSVRVSFVPDTLELTKYGVFAGFSQIPSSNPGLKQVNQIQSGLFANWRNPSWRIFGAFFYIYNDMEINQPSSNLKSASFANIYGQLEYHFETKWTIYTRLEETFGNKGNDYLALIPTFINSRVLGGVRFDFLKQNAITLEASYLDTDAIGSYSQVVLQWSAVFP